MWSYCKTVHNASRSPAYCQPNAEDQVDGGAETRPPNWHTGVLDQRVMEKVKNSVSGYGSRDQPHACLKSEHSE
jgi:hypothetical protein